MKRYRCHKEVEAFKISGITSPKEGFFLHHHTGEKVSVTDAFMAKHDPKPGDYFVRYADGYESISPAKAFEEGYTLIEDGMTLRIEASIAPEDIKSPVLGVGRMFDNDRAVLVVLWDKPSDDDLRDLHQFLRGWRPANGK